MSGAALTGYAGLTSRGLIMISRDPLITSSNQQVVPSFSTGCEMGTSPEIVADEDICQFTMPSFVQSRVLFLLQVCLGRHVPPYYQQNSIKGTEI